MRADGEIEGPHGPPPSCRSTRRSASAGPSSAASCTPTRSRWSRSAWRTRFPNTRLFHQAWRVCGEVGFAPYELPGSVALGAIVADTFAQGFDCVILENHGVVTAGARLQEAFRRFETLEFTAKTIIKARLLGGDIRFLTDDELESSSRATRRARRFAPRTPSSEENEVRRRLSEFVRRAYRQRLFISTQGSFSARVDDRRSSSRRTRWTAARSSRGSRAGARRPRRSGQAAQPRRGHPRRDLPQHPEIGAIINAYPVNATAFSVTGCRSTPAPSRRATSSSARWRGRRSACSSATARELAALIGPRRPAVHPGKRRRAGDRRRCARSLRPPGSAGIHRRGDHQLPRGRPVTSPRRRGDRRIGCGF